MIQLVFTGPNMMQKSIVVLVFLLTIVPIVAARDYQSRDDVLFFDQPPAVIQHLDFDQDDPITPQSNDFSITEIFHLSNRRGERWALITFKNDSSGQRIIKNENVVATFADGSQIFAKNLDEKFSGGEQLTRSVFFGFNRYPIIRVSVDD